jgi:hypothetical protein
MFVAVNCQCIFRCKLTGSDVFHFVVLYICAVNKQIPHDIDLISPIQLVFGVVDVRH